MRQGRGRGWSQSGGAWLLVLASLDHRGNAICTDRESKNERKNALTSSGTKKKAKKKARSWGIREGKRARRVRRERSESKRAKGHWILLNKDSGYQGYRASKRLILIIIIFIKI